MTFTTDAANPHSRPCDAIFPQIIASNDPDNGNQFQSYQSVDPCGPINLASSQADGPDVSLSALLIENAWLKIENTKLQAECNRLQESLHQLKNSGSGVVLESGGANYSDSESETYYYETDYESDSSEEMSEGEEISDTYKETLGEIRAEIEQLKCHVKELFARTENKSPEASYSIGKASSFLQDKSDTNENSPMDGCPTPSHHPRIKAHNIDLAASIAVNVGQLLYEYLIGSEYPVSARVDIFRIGELKDKDPELQSILNSVVLKELQQIYERVLHNAIMMN